jgi:hypothetical protein
MLNPENTSKRNDARSKFNAWADANETGENPKAPILAVTEVANG